MPVLKIVNMAGKETGEITLSDAVFGAEVNATVLHTAVKAYLARDRVHSQPLHVLRFQAAAESRGVRKEPAVRDRDPQDLLNGHTVGLRLDRNPENTRCLSIRKLEKSLSAARSATRLPVEI